MKTLDGSRRSDWRYEIDKWLIDLITKYKYANIFFIRKMINKEYSNKVGWNTLKRHIDYLLEQNKIILKEKMEFPKKTTRIYGLPNIEICEDDEIIIKKEIWLLKTKIKKLQDKLNIKKNKNRNPILNKTRFYIFKRDDFTCQYCGRSPKTDKDVILEIDYKIPVRKGGVNRIDNLITSCRECNTGKKIEDMKDKLSI